MVDYPQVSIVVEHQICRVKIAVAEDFRFAFEFRTELDKFCDALISIYHEIMEVAEGKFAPEESVLKNAPHTAERVMADGSWKTIPLVGESKCTEEKRRSTLTGPYASADPWLSAR